VRKRWVGTVIAAAVGASALTLAQRGGGPTAGGPGAGGQAPIPCINDWQRADGCVPRKGTHNPRDLSGVWMRVKGAANMTAAADALLTPLGRKLFEANRPSFGPRAVPPVRGNDPLGKCNPLGLMRNVFTEIAARSFEFVHLPERTLQFFEYGHQYRTIWTDDRSLAARFYTLTEVRAILKELSLAEAVVEPVSLPRPRKRRP